MTNPKERIGNPITKHRKSIKSECPPIIGFILERGLAGFPQFGKKMPHKIYVAASNALPPPQIFLSTVFENITDNNTDFTAAL